MLERMLKQWRERREPEPPQEDEAREAEITGALRAFGDAIRREQDATGRQIVRRADEAAIATQRQFTEILQTTERLIERADEAALFFDGVTVFMRDLPQLAKDTDLRRGLEELNRKLDEQARSAERRHEELRAGLEALSAALRDVSDRIDRRD